MAETRNNKKSNDDRRSGMIIVIVLTFIVLLAVMFNMSKNGFFSAPTTGSISLNRIDISISSEQGEHKVYVGLSITGDSNKLNKLNMEEVQFTAKEHLKTLDYNSIKSEDGLSYIKDEVLSELNDRFGDDITGVNIESILTDFELPPEVDTSSAIQNVIDGLKFGN